MSAVRMAGVSKRFGRVHACERIDLEVRRGETHAIVGENGAGKTTLMRVLYGIYQPDEGEIEVAGQAARFRSSQEAIARGIGMVSQHYSIIPELTCLDNLMLGHEAASAGVLRRREAARRADELAKRMGFQFRWSAPASTLSPAAAQKLEILKLLWREAEILILDEPTAMLSPPDAAALFRNLRPLAQEGKTILLVTHRLREVVDYCDRVTVLRGGRKVADCDVSETDINRLATWIVGEDLRPREEGLPPPERRETALSIRDLTVLGDRGDTAVNGLSLELARGRITGVAGVDGNGQAELVDALTGLRRARSGTVLLGGRDITHLPTAGRLAAGLRFIPEDRHRRGLIEDWPFTDNAILGLHRTRPIARGGLIRSGQARAAAERQSGRFRIKVDSLDAPASDLSGGNQQRLVVARALHQQPKALIAFQPTRGLDIRGAATVYDAIRQACGEGAAALVISFDLDELLDHCEPVCVMRDGRIVAALEGGEIERERIGRLMVGAEEGW